MIVATAGPIDHGKTALVCALTGIDTISSMRPNHRSASFLITLKSRIALPSDAKNATYCAAGRFTSTSMVNNLES
jgi:translation initiation factor 2 gamma subunit (eIF-2gamma)